MLIMLLLRELLVGELPRRRARARKRLKLAVCAPPLLDAAEALKRQRAIAGWEERAHLCRRRRALPVLLVRAVCGGVFLERRERVGGAAERCHCRWEGEDGEEQ